MDYLCALAEPGGVPTVMDRSFDYAAICYYSGVLAIVYWRQFK